MLDLFKAECRRFRWIVLAAALGNFGLLAFFDRVFDVLQQPLLAYRLAAIGYALVGALLGLYQAGSYRRINQWITLLHRPLPRARIMLAVTGAGVALLVVAIAIPVALLLIGHGASGGRFVDARHWLLPFSALSIALIGYFGGVYAILGKRRCAWAALIPALLPLMSDSAGWGALAIQMLVVAALAALVWTAFKPDLETAPRRPLALAGTALAVAMGVHVVIVVVGGLVFQIGWIATGTDPLNGTPPRGGIVEASRANGGALIDAGLAGRHDPQARLWREQIALSEVFRIQPGFARLPARGDLTNVMPQQFTDPRRGIRWTFSHDDMLFHGVDLATRRRIGTRGIGAANTAFTAPPLPGDGGQLLSASGLYVFNEDDGHIRARIRLPKGEALAAPPVPVGDAVALLSDSTLRFYDARVLAEGDALYPPLTSVSLPGPIGNLLRIDLIELLDGYLVSFTYGRDSVNGPHDSWQQIVRVDDAGRASPVARRALAADYPMLSRFDGWWVSPALRWTRAAVEHAFAGADPLALQEPVRVPRPILGLAAALALLSAAGAAALATRWRLGRAERAAWTIATLAFGPPMLASLWLIHPEPTPPT